MLIYLIMIAVIIALGIIIFLNGVTPRKKIVFLVLSFFIMFLIMGFRDISVGTDTELYCVVFKQRVTQSFMEIINGGDIAVLYGIYNKIIGFISTDIHTIIFFNSAIILTLTAIFIYKNSNHVIYSTLLFITFYHYFSAFNIARQYIAILIVANAFTYLKEKNIKKYILTCIIATLIHNTAIISLALIPLFFIKLNKKNLIIYAICITLMFALLPQLMNLFATFFPHYQIYLEQEYVTSVSGGRMIIIAIYVLISILAFLSYNGQEQEEDREYALLNLINIFAILISILAMKMSILSRISLYFTIFIIIFVPKVFDRIKGKEIAYFFFIIIMFIPMLARLADREAEVVPYSSYLTSSIVERK